MNKSEKEAIGKPTAPKPEVDLIAFDITDNIIFLIEVKSYIDSNGVDYNEIMKETPVQEGRYKILTSKTYQKVLTNRLKEDWMKDGFINADTKFSFGLIAGKIRKGKEDDLLIEFKNRGWLFWGPTILKEKLEKLQNKSYENNPITIAVKLLNPKK